MSQRNEYKQKNEEKIDSVTEALQAKMANLTDFAEKIKSTDEEDILKITCETAEEDLDAITFINDPNHNNEGFKNNIIALAKRVYHAQTNKDYAEIETLRKTADAKELDFAYYLQANLFKTLNKSSTSLLSQLLNFMPSFTQPDPYVDVEQSIKANETNSTRLVSTNQNTPTFKKPGTP